MDKIVTSLHTVCVIVLMLGQFNVFNMILPQSVYGLNHVHLNVLISVL